MFFFFKNLVFYENGEKYDTAKQDTNGNRTRRMRIACWITKATDTQSECVILIAFPLQHWLHEVASLLRYTYIDCLV